MGLIDNTDYWCLVDILEQHRKSGMDDLSDREAARSVEDLFETALNRRVKEGTVVVNQY